MKNKCNIIKDLLPSYVDGLTSNDTNEFVEEHLNTCKDCSDEIKKYKSIEIKEKEETKKSIDYLKKPRRKLKGVIALFSMIIIGIFAFLIVPKPDKNLDLTAFDYNIVNDNLEVKISPLSSNRFIRLKEIINNDEIHLQTYTTPLSFLGDYSVNYIVSGKEDKKIYLNDTLISEKGQYFDQNNIKLFENRIEYIGDNSGVSNIINMLKLSNFSTYNIEIQSTSEPYGLKFNFTEEIVENDNTINFLNTIGKYVMALVNNCDYVTFSYNENQYTVNREDSFDNELKSGYATSPKQLMEIANDLLENL